MDTPVQAFAAVQGWVFETAVQPLIFHLDLMAFVEEAYDAVGTVLIGAIEIGVLCTVLKPLEAWRPVEQWQERKAVRADVIYTWLHRQGQSGSGRLGRVVVDGFDGARAVWWCGDHDQQPDGTYRSDRSSSRIEAPVRGALVPGQRVRP